MLSSSISKGLDRNEMITRRQLMRTICAATLLVLMLGLAGCVQSGGRAGPDTGAPWQRPSSRAAAPVEKPSDASSANLPRLLELGSETCKPCQMMKPVLEELRTAYQGKLEVDFIDVWQDPEAAKAYGVQAIPTQIFFDSKGKEIFRHIGFFPKEDIVRMFLELGIKL